MNNLQLPLVASNQNQKEVTINDQAMALDAAFSEAMQINMESGNVTVSVGAYTRNFLFQCSGSDDPRTLTVPVGVKRLFAVQNENSADLTVKVAGGGSVAIPGSNTAVLMSDGSTVRTLAASLDDAPLDGKIYARKDGFWIDITDLLEP